MIKVDKQELVNAVMREQRMFAAFCNDATFRAIYEVLLHNDTIEEKALLDLILTVCTQNQDVMERLQQAISRMPLPVIYPPKPDSDVVLPDKDLNLLARYKAALEKAYLQDDLRCHVLDIKDKIAKIESGTYQSTVLDDVWVDYFLGRKDTDKRWEVFADRVKSLLERWDNFHVNHPHVPDSSIIRNCLTEVNDDYTKHLMRGDSEMEQFIKDNKDSYKDKI